MIQNKQNNECYTSASKSTSSFSMVSNQNTFSILSDSLYTHKERAVAREYITNAFDSHVDAGCPEKPFRVHVPTQLSPYFEVEDYGVGLGRYEVEVYINAYGRVLNFKEDARYSGRFLRLEGHDIKIPLEELTETLTVLPEGKYTAYVDEILDIYTTFFLSTKGESEDTNGCLGLGSKSAYAVSEQFTIVSRKLGKELRYSCYKDREGIPQAALKSSKATSLGNGTAIKIPVSSTSLVTWQEELNTIIAYYETTPAHNITDESWLYSLKQSQNNSAKLRASEGGYIDLQSSGTTMVLMGNVLYPIEDASQYIRVEKVRTLAKSVMGSVKLSLNVPLGSLNIAPSREALSLDRYTKRTLERLITRVVVSQLREILGGMEAASMEHYIPFYRKFKDTELWSTLLDLKLPFTKGSPLKNYEEAYVYGRVNTNYIYPLLHATSKKGLVPRTGRQEPELMSGALTMFTHKRLRSISNIKIAVGVSVRLRDTLLAAKDAMPEVGAFLYASDDREKEYLMLVLGLSDKDVIHCEEYYTEKVRKKAAYRKKKVHRETVMVMASDPNPYRSFSYTYSEIDLSASGLCWVEDKKVFTSLTKEGKAYCEYSTEKSFKKIVEYVGMNRVLLVNKNNRKKIIAAGVPKLQDLWKEAATPHKRDLVRNYVWRNHSEVARPDRNIWLLRDKSRSWKRLRKVEENLNPIPEGFPITRLSYLGLDKGKLFEKEKTKCCGLVVKSNEEVDKIVDKLPLWDNMYDQEDAAYYLRLEKIIK